MSDEAVTMSARFRLALLGKGLLLGAIAVLFAALAAAAWTKWHWPLLARASGLLLTLLAAAWVGWAAALALLDVLRGQALRSTGAKPLESRRSGYSLRLPGSP
ncbi:MAG: hypothetical protein HY906_22700 [Deltaproteobacteria bacterium]|nr:hypothetical protein [Deltaproteobacteria bacterium]